MQALSRKITVYHSIDRKCTRSRTWHVLLIGDISGDDPSCVTGQPSSYLPVMSLYKLQDKATIHPSSPTLGDPTLNEAIGGEPPSPMLLDVPLDTTIQDPSPPSPITSLDALTEHVDIQTEAINNLPSGAITPFPSLGSWDSFRKEYWGKKLTSLEKPVDVHRGSDPIPDEDLEEKPPSNSFVLKLPERLPLSLGLSSTKIVVRSEYNEAEEVAVSSAKAGIKLFVVRGSPGIGNYPFSLC